MEQSVLSCFGKIIQEKLIRCYLMQLKYISILCFLFSTPKYFHNFIPFLENRPKNTRRSTSDHPPDTKATWFYPVAEGKSSALCVCMYVGICINIFVLMYAVYLCMCICVFVCQCVCACMCVCEHLYVRGAFNKFLDFFVQAFKIVVDSWKFTMLLLYILWDDWPISMISDLNEQLQ